MTSNSLAFTRSHSTFSKIFCSSSVLACFGGVGTWGNVSSQIARHYAISYFETHFLRQTLPEVKQQGVLTSTALYTHAHKTWLSQIKVIKPTSLLCKAATHTHYSSTTFKKTIKKVTRPCTKQRPQKF